MKKVLIFGKDGQLGFDLCRVFEHDYNLLAYNHYEADITSADAVSSIVQKEKPDFVINATAYNKVEQAETEKDLAFRVNAEGVENLAKASALAGAVFIHVSTDYVFDGNKYFFEESDIPNPLNVYGQSKLKGEELVKSSTSKFFIVRTSAVFGVKEAKQKMNFVDRMVSMAKEGKEIKVVSDQFTCPTYSLDLAYKIKELIEKPAPFGIYHITNSSSCSWFEFAVKILEMMHLPAKVEPIKADEHYGSKVKRPKMSVLKNSAIKKIGLTEMPNWENALERYLKEKYKI